VPMLEAPGADLYYEVRGEGPPLLLISSTACDGEFWKPYQVPEFSRDHRVITYDQRGTGKTKTRSDDYSTTRMAADAALLIEHLGLGPANVLGHSMGGRVAQLVALNHPHLVERLILASTGASFAVKDGIPPAICLKIIKKGYETYIRDHSIEIGFSKGFVALRPDRVKQCVDLVVQSLPPIEIYFAHVIARQQHDTSDRLQDISVPTLVIVGDDEVHGTPHMTHVDSSKVLANGIPRAQFAILAGQGHYYFFSDPEATHRTIREFIARTTP
jgi:3-oxoadipate enol-lactonase